MAPLSLRGFQSFTFKTASQSPGCIEQNKMRKTIELMFTRIKLLICISCIMFPAAASSMDKTNTEITLTPELIEAVNSYDDVFPFYEGLAIVVKNGKYGYISTTGKEIIPCMYDRAYRFSKGLAIVEKDDKSGYVNAKGEQVTPCIYDGASAFSEGLACVKKNGKCGYINTKGVEVIPCIYDDGMYNGAGDFSEGLAIVEKDDKWGYINTKGELVVPFIYDVFNDWDESTGFQHSRAFSDGLALVKKDDKWGFINTKGKEVIPCIYTDAKSFSEGLAPVEKNGEWGYINTKGEEVIHCIYDQAWGFSEGLAPVKKDGKAGFVDKEGNSSFQDYRPATLKKQASGSEKSKQEQNRGAQNSGNEAPVVPDKIQSVNTIKSFFAHKPQFKCKETGTVLTLAYSSSMDNFEAYVGGKCLGQFEVDTRELLPTVAMIRLPRLNGSGRAPMALYLKGQNTKCVLMPVQEGEATTGFKPSGYLQRGKTAKTNWIKFSLSADGISFTTVDHKPSGETFLFIGFSEQ